MSVPVPGPPCVFENWSEPLIWYYERMLEMYEEGSFTFSDRDRHVVIYDKLHGKISRPYFVETASGLPYNMGWVLGDLCYGMTYRTLYPESVLDDPAWVRQMRSVLEPGSCCYSQMTLMDTWEGMQSFPLGMPFVAPLCWNYTTHTAPTCETRYGYLCCASTQGGGWDSSQQAYVGDDWDIFDRQGVSKWSCENWLVGGAWVPRGTCQLELVDESVMCPTICDLTPYACCGCGRLCLDLTNAQCAQKGGGFHRGFDCWLGLCEDTDRPCAMNHWAMTLRPYQHYPTQPGYNGNRPLAEPGDHMPYALANPCQRQKSPAPSSDVNYGPACHAHYGALQQEENGDFVLVICGNTQWEDLTSNGVPYGLTDTDANFRAQRGEIQRREDGDHVWPIAYRPACSTPTDWSWD